MTGLFYYICFPLLPTEWSCSICLLVISMTVVESVYRICFYITCSCRINPDMFLLYILTYTLLYIFISKLAFSKYWKLEIHFLYGLGRDVLSKEQSET